MNNGNKELAAEAEFFDSLGGVVPDESRGKRTASPAEFIFRVSLSSNREQQITSLRSHFSNRKLIKIKPDNSSWIS